ncbi:jg1817 [Pararge aegeria aegeria]|uniref:Jg1817 protein n=1 Tax=Pararge aegeria aegeria TaxID=348720 RepID=A0A8S4QVC6_9NEOP|nr:jg1817 [Pararge aegeria aegeria]
MGRPVEKIKFGPLLSNRQNGLQQKPTVYQREVEISPGPRSSVMKERPERETRYKKKEIYNNMQTTRQVDSYRLLNNKPLRTSVLSSTKARNLAYIASSRMRAASRISRTRSVRNPGEYCPPITGEHKE